MKLKNVLLLFTFFLIVFMCSSCEDSTGTGTLRLQLETSFSKTIDVNSSIYNPVKFSLTGTGPGNSTLSLESSSSLIVREGVILGNWTFTSNAYNSDGQVIATGQKTFNLDASSELHNLVLEKDSSNGQIKLNFEWNQSIVSPKVVVKLESVFSSYSMVKTINAGENASSTSLSISDIPPDTYYIYSYLESNTDIIAGFVDIIVVASNNRTSGTIDFSAASSGYENIQMTVNNPGSSKLKGSISCSSTEFSSGKPTTFALQIDNLSTINPSLYQVVWFYDGEEIKRGSSFAEIYPQAGNHILNAVLIDITNKTAGSASVKFSSTLQGKPGTAVVDCIISKPEDSSCYSSIGNDRFIFVSSLKGSISLHHLENSLLIKDYEVFSSEENWEFLDNANSIYSSEESDLFAVIDSYSNVNILRYDSVNKSINLAYHGKDVLRYVGGGSVPNMKFSYISAGYIGPCSIVISDENMVKSVCYKTEEDTVTMICSLYDPDNLPNVSGFTTCGNFILTASVSSENLFYAKFDGIGKTSPWKSIRTSLSGISYIHKLNDTSLIVANSRYICRYSLSGTETWALRGSVACSAKDICVSPGGKFIYVLTNSNTLITYRLIGATIEWQYESSIPILIDKIIATENSILGISNSDSIAVFTIIKEEL